MLESQHSTDGCQCCVTVILCGRLGRKCQNRTKQQQQQQKNPKTTQLCWSDTFQVRIKQFGYGALSEKNAFKANTDHAVLFKKLKGALCKKNHW